MRTVLLVACVLAVVAIAPTVGAGTGGGSCGADVQPSIDGPQARVRCGLMTCYVDATSHDILVCAF